jgi:hypothetical protein
MLRLLKLEHDDWGVKLEEQQVERHHSEELTLTSVAVSWVELRNL